MRKSRFTTEQIISFLKQAEAGMAVAELGRQHGFSPGSFYQWRAKYGGMEAEDAKRLKELETENNRLKRLLAEAHLDIEALKVGFGGITLPPILLALSRLIGSLADITEWQVFLLHPRSAQPSHH